MIPRGACQQWPKFFFELGHPEECTDTRLKRWTSRLEQAELVFTLDRTWRGMLPIRNHMNCHFPGEYLYVFHDENLPGKGRQQATMMPFPACFVTPLNFLIQTARTNRPSGLSTMTCTQFIALVVSKDLLFGMSLIEMYVTLRHGLQFFYSRVSRFLDNELQNVATLRLRYFVGRLVWDQAKMGGDVNVRFATGRRWCVLGCTLDDFLERHRVDNMKTFFCPNKTGRNVMPLELQVNFDLVAALALQIHNDVLGLRKHDPFYKDIGKLKIPHTPRVRQSFMKCVRSQWLKYLTGENWRKFVVQKNFPAELAFRGTPLDQLEEKYLSDDMTLITVPAPAQRTRSTARRKSNGKGASTSGDQERVSFRRACFSGDDESDDDVEMEDVTKIARKKRQRTAKTRTTSRARKKSRFQDTEFF